MRGYTNHGHLLCRRGTPITSQQLRVRVRAHRDSIMSGQGAEIITELRALAAAGHPEAAQSIIQFSKQAISRDDLIAIGRCLLAEQASEQAKLLGQYGAPVERPKSSTAAAVPGFLFMASGKTFGECMSRSLLGESARNLRAMQDAIKPKTPLFLLHFTKRILYGPFYAAAPPALDLEPDAWLGGATRGRGSGDSGGSGGRERSPYPAQVRIYRSDAVRSWTLPKDVHLDAGRIEAAQTVHLLDGLRQRGTRCSKADAVSREAATKSAPSVPAASAAHSRSRTIPMPITPIPSMHSATSQGNSSHGCGSASASVGANSTPAAASSSAIDGPAPDAGFLFMASGKTFGECMSRSLLGESARNLRAMQDAIKPKTPLFLLHFTKRILYGPFYAAAPPALDLEPDAWLGGATRGRGSGDSGGSGGRERSPYPAQVRIYRSDAVRSWTLPKDVHLDAGRIEAAQTVHLLDGLRQRGTRCSEADAVSRKAATKSAQASPSAAPANSPPVAPCPRTETQRPQRHGAADASEVAQSHAASSGRASQQLQQERGTHQSAPTPFPQFAPLASPIPSALPVAKPPPSAHAAAPQAIAPTQRMLVLVDGSSVAAAHQPLEMGYLNLAAVDLALHDLLSRDLDVVCMIPVRAISWPQARGTRSLTRVCARLTWPYEHGIAPALPSLPDLLPLSLPSILPHAQRRTKARSPQPEFLAGVS